MADAAGLKERNQIKYVHTALQLLIKGGSVEETLGLNSHQTENLNFSATEIRVGLLLGGRNSHHTTLNMYKKYWMCSK